MNIFTYQILSLLLLPFAFFRLVLRAFKQRQYFDYWGERLGFYPKYLKNILKMCFYHHTSSKQNLNYDKQFFYS